MRSEGLGRRARVAKTEYRTIDLRTLEGFRQAELLVEEGWKVGSVGFHTVQLYRRTERSSVLPDFEASSSLGG